MGTKVFTKDTEKQVNNVYLPSADIISAAPITVIRESNKTSFFISRMKHYSQLGALALFIGCQFIH